MRYITETMIDAFHNYLNQWTPPTHLYDMSINDRPDDEACGLVAPIRTQEDIQNTLQHRDQLQKILSTLIENERLKHIDWNHYIQNEPTIFDDLQTVGTRLIQTFNQVDTNNALCAFVQLFDWYILDHIIKLINSQISKCTRIINANFVDLYSENDTDCLKPLIQQQMHHWKPNDKFSPIINFFYRIINLQLQPLFQEYDQVINHHQRLDPDQDANWNHGIKLDDSTGLNRHSRDLMTFKYDYPEQADGASYENQYMIYAINTIVDVLNLDKDLLRMFHRYTDYLRHIGV